jgi:caspase domain-containing protein
MIHRFVATRIILLGLAMLLLATSASHSAQNRIALVIGNSAYTNVPALPNPANDAADVSQSLQRLGFKVTTVADAKFDAFRQALVEFGRAARGADMAVVFFAGHGVEIAGENWLLPVDVEIKNDLDADTEALSLRSAMLAVSNAKLLGLVILDACRNNPFADKTRGIRPSAVSEAGLAPVEPNGNVLVAYAARDGTTARDGTGRNSPYTTALLQHIETPGLEVEFLFRNVRDDVLSATNDEQQPFVYGSLSREEIYLKDGGPVQVAYNTAAVASDAGELAWSFLKRTSDTDTLRRFITQFPTSNRVSDVKLRLASLEKTPDAAASSVGQTYLASAEFDTLTRQTARPFLKNTPAVEAAWKLVRRTNDATVIRRFAEQFPSRERQTAATQRLTELGEPAPISRELLLRAAGDADVIQCYRTNDMAAAECRRALERFPGLGAFLSDFRFRLRLCEALGERGRCNAVVADAWARPLFLPSHHHHHTKMSKNDSDKHSNRHNGQHKASNDGDKKKSSAKRHASNQSGRDRDSNKGNKNESNKNNGNKNNGSNKTASNAGPSSHSSGGGGGRHR